jgi:hypothetical protein
MTESIYHKWVKDNVPAEERLGQCQKWSKQIAEVFPELRIARGWVYCELGERTHWWCIAPDGTVVDPTASQFNWVFEYREFTPGDLVQVGKCMECGQMIEEEVFDLDKPTAYRRFCDSACRSAFAASLGLKP